jgi:hypothetical protein
VVGDGAEADPLVDRVGSRVVGVGEEDDALGLAGERVRAARGRDRAAVAAAAASSAASGTTESSRS